MDDALNCTFIIVNKLYQTLRACICKSLIKACVLLLCELDSKRNAYFPFNTYFKFETIIKFYPELYNMLDRTHRLILGHFIPHYIVK